MSNNPITVDSMILDGLAASPGTIPTITIGASDTEYMFMKLYRFVKVHVTGTNGTCSINNGAFSNETQMTTVLFKCSYSGFSWSNYFGGIYKVVWPGGDPPTYSSPDDSLYRIIHLIAFSKDVYGYYQEKNFVVPG